MQSEAEAVIAEEGDAAIAARLGISREVVRKRRQMARQFLRGRPAGAAPAE